MAAAGGWMAEARRTGAKRMRRGDGARAQRVSHRSVSWRRATGVARRCGGLSDGGRPPGRSRPTPCVGGWPSNRAWLPATPAPTPPSPSGECPVSHSHPQRRPRRQACPPSSTQIPPTRHSCCPFPTQRTPLGLVQRNHKLAVAGVRPADDHRHDPPAGVLELVRLVLEVEAVHRPPAGAVFELPVARLRPQRRLNPAHQRGISREREEREAREVTKRKRKRTERGGDAVGAPRPHRGGSGQSKGMRANKGTNTNMKTRHTANGWSRVTASEQHGTKRPRAAAAVSQL